MAHGHHIIPIPTLLKVFAGLVGITIVKAFLALNFELGALDIPMVLVLAGVKTYLVAGYFMMLKYDNPVNSLTFIVGILFVGIFLIFTLLDTAFRGDLDNVDEMSIDERERMMEELDGVEPEDLQETEIDDE